MTALVLAILVITGVVIFRYWQKNQKPFVIMAQPGAIKTVPQERGGMYIPKNMTIHDALVSRKKMPEPTMDKVRVILGTFSSEKQAQKGMLRFLSLAPDVFQKQTPVVEKKGDDLYAVIAYLSESEQQRICVRIEEQGGGCLVEELTSDTELH